MNSLDQVDRVTIAEYEIMAKAVQQKNEELDYLAHWQAFLNQLIKSTKKNGQPVYKKFKSFYKPPGEHQNEDRFKALAEYKRRKEKEEQEQNG